MRVCIPIEFKPQGGGHYFLRFLKDHLEASGWEVVHALEADYDLLFTNHWMVSRIDILRAMRYNPNVRIVQRIDGAAQDYGRKDNADDRQRAVNRLADLTIFQSAYCRYATREKFPVIGQDGPIIHNPVNGELFSPDGPRLTKDFAQDVLVACTTWSTNPLKGAASVYQVARENPEVGFVLCGRYPDVPDLPNIYPQGVLDRQQLATALRSVGALLTFSQNEACPNHVIEALSSGLPVLYIDSGAMAEVVGDCGLPVTVENFSQQLARLMADHEQLAACARQRALTAFHPDFVFGRYMAEMEQAVERPPTLSPEERIWLAWHEFAIVGR